MDKKDKSNSKSDPMLMANHEQVVVALRQLAGLRSMPAKPSALHLRVAELCKAVVSNKAMERSNRSVAASKRSLKAA